jgi:hypothetical protein
VRASLPLLFIAAALAAASGGCGGGDDSATTETAPATSKREPAPANREAAPRRSLEQASCPSGVPGCRSATGRIVYVERVDPDGDGDAHFVIVDPQGISLPGLTSIDVRRGLRPHPLPGPGDLVSVAGPVQTGSYGQHQIHALELNVAERGG